MDEQFRALSRRSWDSDDLEHLSEVFPSLVRAGEFKVAGELLLRLASVGQDVDCFWDEITPTSVRDFRLEPVEAPRSLREPAWSPDGLSLYALSNNSEVVSWRKGSWTTLHAFPMNRASSRRPEGLTVSPRDGRLGLILRSYVQWRPGRGRGSANKGFWSVGVLDLEHGWIPNPNLQGSGKPGDQTLVWTRGKLLVLNKRKSVYVVRPPDSSNHSWSFYAEHAGLCVAGAVAIKGGALHFLEPMSEEAGGAEIPLPETDVKWSVAAAGKRAVLEASGSGRVSLWSREGKLHEIAVAPGRSRPYPSPSGLLLARVQGRRFDLICMRTSEAKHFELGSAITNVTWDPAGQHLAISTRSGALHLVQRQ